MPVVFVVSDYVTPAHPDGDPTKLRSGVIVDNGINKTPFTLTAAPPSV